MGVRMGSVSYWARVRGRYMRESARRFCRRPFTVNNSTPLISFTFDDFPRSALHTGGAILEKFGLVGTYYASFGLMGKEAPTGTMFMPEDLKLLLDHGHELGCHTFGHCNSWETDPSAFEESVIQNQSALSNVIPGVSFRTLSYPISVPRPRTKQKIAKYFACCRCGGQTCNVGEVDSNYLSAYFLEKSRNEPAKVKKVIEENRLAKGWLIFATHDVCESPTPYGCTPGFFEDIVRSAIGSGARILPVIQAWEALHNSVSS
jgi:peptidoglycan/xylan/chitin deacetylase (PgdA/CDA1 family)